MAKKKEAVIVDYYEKGDIGVVWCVTLKRDVNGGRKCTLNALHSFVKRESFREEYMREWGLCINKAFSANSFYKKKLAKEIKRDELEEYERIQKICVKEYGIGRCVLEWHPLM